MSNSSSCEDCGFESDTNSSSFSNCSVKKIKPTKQSPTHVPLIIPYEESKYFDKKVSSNKEFRYPFNFGFRTTHTKWLMFVIAVDWVVVFTIGGYSLLILTFAPIFIFGGGYILIYALIGIILAWFNLKTIDEVAKYDNLAIRDNIALILATMVFILVNLVTYSISTELSYILLILMVSQLFVLFFHKQILELFSDEGQIQHNK